MQPLIRRFAPPSPTRGEGSATVQQLLSGDEIADDPFQLGIIRSDMMRAGLRQSRGMTIGDMSGREQPDHNGARGPSRNDPARAILDDDAVGRRHSNLSRG